MQISDFLQPENVLMDLACGTKAEVLKRASDAAGRALDLPADAILEALAARERLGSTGIGGGIAIPHARVPGLSHPFGLLMRLPRAVAFEAVDDIAVDVVFVLLLPEDNAKAHLNVLACIARRLRTPAVLAAMRGAADRAALYAVTTAPADPVASKTP